jgi:hypothetical protein
MNGSMSADLCGEFFEHEMLILHFGAELAVWKMRRPNTSALIKPLRRPERCPSTISHSLSEAAHEK